MKRVRSNKLLVLVFAVVATIAAAAGVIVVQKLIPSKKVMDLTQYYQVDSDKIKVILENRISEEPGLYLEGVAYIDYDTAAEYLNHRFYWDAHENVLIYTTQAEVVKTEIGSSEYYQNKSKSSVSYQIVKTIGNKVYVAIDYVKLFSNIEYTIYEKPNRIVIHYDWGQDYLVSDVKKNTQLRYGPSIKSDILVQLKENESLTYVDVEEVKGSKFKKVITTDGIIGYVKAKHVASAKYKTLDNGYKEKPYSHITKDYTVSLGWHQVTNQSANNNLLAVLEQSKGINTISPTWFSVADNQGNITSLASEAYVSRAHNAGVEVWALCDDFNKEADINELLSYTSRREKLENELIASAFKFDLDGINIDFENITAKSAKHYIQFLRELSIKCRNNGIVLSVDNYVPASYNRFYDLEEQGKVVDYVAIMAYDEHHSNSEESGSVSSIGFFQKAIEDTLKEVGKERVIAGIPFYTRLWTEKADGSLTSAAYGMGAIRTLLEENGAKVNWDEETGQNYAEYKTADGVNKVWLEDEKSIERRMKTASEAGVAGMAYWKLGMEKANVWNTIQKFIN